jgi:transcriptional regulator with XRE-family HTH domain
MRSRINQVRAGERRLRAAALYEQGLSMREITEELGITRQAVQYLLRTVAYSIRCRCCRTVIYQGPRSLSGRGSVLCQNCLEALPEATFGERLRSARLVSGMSLRRLAHETGVTPASLSLYEREVTEPTWSVLLRIMRVLGFGFVAAGVKEGCVSIAQNRLAARQTLAGVPEVEGDRPIEAPKAAAFFSH